MRFILDENIPRSVSDRLSGAGYDVQYIRELIPEGSVDQLVAFVAEDQGAVLITFDGDFQKISPRIPDGQKTRFKNLSRIWMRCSEFQAADRLEKALSFMELEFEVSRTNRDQRMQLQIATTFIRSNR